MTTHKKIYNNMNYNIKKTTKILVMVAVILHIELRLLLSMYIYTVKYFVIYIQG
jgi:hypothetical protein